MIMDLIIYAIMIYLGYKLIFWVTSIGEYHNKHLKDKK